MKLAAITFIYMVIAILTGALMFFIGAWALLVGFALNVISFVWIFSRDIDTPDY